MVDAIQQLAAAVAAGYIAALPILHATLVAELAEHGTGAAALGRLALSPVNAEHFASWLAWEEQRHPAPEERVLLAADLTLVFTSAARTVDLERAAAKTRAVLAW